ncbi:tRNA (guanine-N(7)-)-methyltransferase [Synechococcus sp. PCC 7502]|uniref:tRNA (guanosine(46)-N7)-methyltransferase TrmB n=1 Tax=Synechococcus sp. PCC 7502 TaxID=1173263 RepID=UPI00029F9465|nr:tRNA (guanosine(46)-N7)-methyltransferase TrmB [Synechococcus sp. PCC 7502]AFY75266.1 tRNA (guanine-N(7)-)-methyltransferase [Synechococcus sp. PCC 7502]
MKAIRVREHVNPLGKKYQEPTPPPHWQKIYADFSQPLSLDIGCGKGEYILKMAQLKPDWNWLGLEIREPLVERAIAIQNSLGLKNLHYLFCNVNVSLRHLLPPNSVHQVSIQFPDPWFKRRQHKRRTVQPQLVADLAMVLVPNAQILLQSDIEMVAKEMLKYFEADRRFNNLAGTGNFADDSCYPAHELTDREEWTITTGGTVYRSHLKFMGVTLLN